MKSKNEYRDIKTLEELGAAIHSNHARIEAKSESVQTGLTRVQGFYTPRNLAIQGVRKLEEKAFRSAVIEAVIAARDA